MTALDYFETFTQYDNKYKELVNFTESRSACGLFALLSAHEFISSPMIIGKGQHERCVDYGAINYIYHGAEGLMSFDDLLKFTDLNSDKVMGTSVELVVNDTIGFNQMFKETFTDPYCVIFLKLSKFFVVYVRPDMYCIRDCHERCQYNFKTRSELIEHLMKTYSFCDELTIEGIKMKDLEQFNNIEFIIIEKPFTLGLDTSIVIPNINDIPYEMDNIFEDIIPLEIYEEPEDNESIGDIDEDKLNEYMKNESYFY